MQYLYENGREKFFKWFDYMSWYPLGRPVGTTIYPGMQFTAVWIKNHIVGDSMSLNDVCCYIPAWFGVIATFLTGLLAYESCLECNCSSSILTTLKYILFPGSKKDPSVTKPTSEIPAILSFMFAMGAMAVMPAHLMRSVGGGYDNESIAMSAMILTFYLWTRSLRAGENKSYLFGILTGFAYFYVSLILQRYINVHTFYDTNIRHSKGTNSSIVCCDLFIKNLGFTSYKIRWLPYGEDTCLF